MKRMVIISLLAMFTVMQVQAQQIKLESLLSGENSLKQLLLTNNQLVTRLIKFFD